MLEHQWEAWPPNAFLPGNYSLVDSSKRWLPSPAPSLFPELFAETHAPHNPVIPNVKAWEAFPKFKTPQVVTRQDAFKRRSSWINPRRWMEWFTSKRRKRSPSVEDWPSLYDERKVTAADWRAYGYWARPTINGVQVRNSTPPPIRRRLTVAQTEALMHSLNNQNGDDPHPEKWVSYLEHPCLPPRPALWRTPLSSTNSQLPSSSIQLNPFLEHRLMGTTPMRFDIRLGADTALVGESPPAPEDPTPLLVFMHPSGPNGAQPATYPGLRQLHVSGIADDPVAKFPWPFTVTTGHESLPITVLDVMDAIYCNFQELMTREEYESLDVERKHQVERAYRVRQAMKRQGQFLLQDKGNVPIADDGVRRADYLGDRCIFRGLEAAPDENGFILFVGPP